MCSRVSNIDLSKYIYIYNIIKNKKHQRVHLPIFSYCGYLCISLCRGGGSGMASMAQAISIVKTVWLTKRSPTLF